MGLPAHVLPAAGTRHRRPPACAAGVLGCESTPARAPLVPVPVVVDTDSARCEVRLDVTEDECSYGVIAEVENVQAEAFDVEVDGKQVYIFLQGVPTVPDSVAAPRENGRRHIAMAFSLPIDAGASRGECSNGLLHLSLCKDRPVSDGAANRHAFNIESP